MLVYSRDALSHPLRLLTEMIAEVASGEFLPDVTRSGLLAKDIRDLHGADLGGDLDEGIEAASSSQGSEDEDDIDAVAEEQAVEQVAGRWQPAARGVEDGAQFFRHRVSRCVHRSSDESGTTLACGRAINSRYELQDVKPKFFHPVCSSCFKDL